MQKSAEPRPAAANWLVGTSDCWKSGYQLTDRDARLHARK
jgi:hypothetical protein